MVRRARLTFNVTSDVYRFLFRIKLHLLSTIHPNPPPPLRELWNPLSKALPVKIDESGGHTKRNCLQDQSNFHKSRAWQIIIILPTGFGLGMGVICFSAQKGRYNMTYSFLFRLYRRFYWRHQCAFHLVWVPPIIRWITYTYHSYFKEIPKSPQRSWQTSAPLITWWRHKMETFSAFSPFCEGNPPVTRGFRSQRPVTRSYDVFCDLRMNKRLDKQSRRRWFETPSLSLWRHFNAADAAHEICNMYIHGKLYSASLFSKRWYISLKTHSCNIWALIHTITLIVFRYVWQITRGYNYLNINLVSGKLNET